MYLWFAEVFLIEVLKKKKKKIRKIRLSGFRLSSNVLQGCIGQVHLSICSKKPSGYENNPSKVT